MEVGEAPDAMVSRGQKIITNLLKDVQEYFRSNDPAKKSDAWHDLDRATLASICASRMAHLTDMEVDPADDNQGQYLEQAVVQEILLGLVEKQIHTTRAFLGTGEMDLQFLTQQFVTMSRDNDHMQKELNRSDAKVLAFWAIEEIEKRSSVDHLRETIRAQDASMQSMQREIVALREHVLDSSRDDNDKSNWSFDSSITEPQWNNLALDASFHELRNSVHANYRDNVDILQEHIVSLERQLQHTSRQMVEMNKLNSMLQSELAQQKAADDPATFVTSMSMLNKQVRELQGALDAATKQNQTLEAELAVPSANLAYLNRQNALLEQRVDIYRKELDDQVALFHKTLIETTISHEPDCHYQFNGVCNDLIESLRAEILSGRDQHRSELLAALDQVRDLTRENHLLRGEAMSEYSDDQSNESWHTKNPSSQSLLAEIASLNELLEEYKQNNATAEVRMEELRLQREMQESDLDQLTQKMISGAKAHDALEREKKALQEDLDRREETIHALQANVFEMKRHIKVMSSDVDALVEEKEILTEENEELRKRPMSGSSTGTSYDCTACPGLRKQIEELSAEVEEAIESKESLESEFHPLRRSLSMKDQTLQEVKARVAELERRLTNDKKEYEKAVGERDHAIEVLQKKVHEYKREVNVLTDDYDSIYEEKHELEEKLEQVEIQIRNLEDELAEMDLLVQSLREDVDKWRMQFELVSMLREEDAANILIFDASYKEMMDQLRSMTELVTSLEASSAEDSVNYAKLVSKREEDVHKLKEVILSQKERVASLTQSENSLKKQLEQVVQEKAAIESEKITTVASLGSESELWKEKYHSIEQQSAKKEDQWLKQQEEWKILHDATVLELNTKASQATSIHEKIQTDYNVLQLKLLEFEREKKNLSEKIQELENKHQTQREHLHGREDELAKLLLALDAASSANANLSTEVQRLKVEHEAVVNELHSARDQMESRIQSLEAEIKKLMASIEGLNDEKSAMTMLVAALEAEVHERTDQCVELDNALSNNKEQTKGEIAAITRSESKLKSELDDILQDKHELEDKLSALDTKAIELQNKYSMQLELCKGHVQENEALDGQVKSLIGVVEQLEKQKAILDDKLSSNSMKYSKLESFIAEKESQLASQEVVVEELNTKLAASISGEESLTRQLEELRHEKSSLDLSVHEQILKLETLCQAHNELESTSQSVSSENARLLDLIETQSKEHAERHVAYEQERNELLKRIESVEFERDSTATKYSVLETAITQKEDDVSKSQLLLQRFKEKVASLTAKEATLTKELEVANASKESLVGQLHESSVEQDDLRLKCADLSEKSMNMQNEIAGLQEACATSVAKSTNLEAELEAKIQQQENSQVLLERFKAKIAEVTKSKAIISDELDKSIKELAEKSSKYDSLSDEVELTRSKLDALTIKYDELCQRFADLEAQLTSSNDKYETSVEKISEQNHVLEHKQEQINKLQELLDQFKEKLAVSNKAESILRMELDQVRDEKVSIEMSLPEQVEKLSSLSRAYSEAELQLKFATDEIEKIREKLAASEDENRTLNENQGILMTQVQELEADAEVKSKVAIETQSVLEKKETDTKKLQTLLNQFKEKVASQMKTVESLKEQLASTSSENLALEETLNTERSAFELLQQSHVDLKQEKDSIELVLEGLRVTHDVATTSHTEHLDQCTNRRDAIEKQLEMTETELYEKNTKCMELEAQIANDADENKKLQLQLQRMRERVATLTKSEETMTRQVVQLSQEKISLEMSLPEQVEQLATLTSSRVELEATVRALEAKKKVDDENLTDMITKCSNLESLLVTKEDQVKKQEKLVLELQTELSALINKEKLLKDDLDQVKADKEMLAHQLTEHEEKNATLNQSRNEMEATTQALTGELKSVSAQLEDSKSQIQDMITQLHTAKQLEARSSQFAEESQAKYLAAKMQFDLETKQIQGDLIAKEEEINHLQELFNDEMSDLKQEEALSNARFEDLTDLYNELTRAHANLSKKHADIESQLNDANEELNDAESKHEEKRANLSNKISHLEDLLAKKDSLVFEMQTTIATANENLQELKNSLEEKTLLLEQLEHLRAARLILTPNQEHLSLTDDYGLLVSENEQLRLGQENLNTIIEMLKQQLYVAKEQHDSLPWVASFVQDVAPVLGLDGKAPSWTLDSLQTTLHDIQTSIHSLTKDGSMKVDELDGSGTWIKAIEESNALNDKAQTLSRQAIRSRDIGTPSTSVSLYPEGMAKDIMSVVLEIVASFGDAASSTNVADTLREAWHYRQRLLRKLVAAMHTVLPLSPNLPREEQVDEWSSEMKNAIVLTTAQNNDLSAALLKMHGLLYPSQVANQAMDLSTWAVYAASEEFAENMNQYIARKEQLEHDAGDLHNTVLPFLESTSNQVEGGNPLSVTELVNKWDADVQLICAAIESLHGSPIDDGDIPSIVSYPSSQKLTRWLRFIRSGAFKHPKLEKDENCKHFDRLLSLGSIVFSTEQLASVTSIEDWRNFVVTEAFKSGITEFNKKLAQIYTENQTLCDALENMHAVLWPHQELKPSMDSTEWSAYIHSQQFIDILRQFSNQIQQKAICEALQKMHDTIASTSPGQALDLSNRSMDLPKWTEYIKSEKFDNRLREYTKRLQVIELESETLCKELDGMHQLVAGESTPVTGMQMDMAQWNDYVHSAQFEETLHNYTLHQEELEADSHDLNAKILPFLREYSTNPIASVDELIDTWRVKLSNGVPKSEGIANETITALKSNVVRLSEFCGLEASTLESESKMDEQIKLYSQQLQNVEDFLTRNASLSNTPPKDLNMEKLVAMMQLTATNDDANMSQLRDILARLEGHQEKWVADMDSEMSEESTKWPEALMAMELAKECQQAAIHVLETHNRTCIAKTRAEIAMKCGVQRAFLRWKHKTSMESIISSHEDEIIALKDKQLNQLIKFRKNALQEQRKAARDAREEATERLTQFFARREEKEKLRRSFTRWQNSREYNEDGRSIGSDESKYSNRRLLARRRDSAASNYSMNTPAKKENLHERVAFGSGVSRNFAPPSAPVVPGQTRSTDPCRTTFDQLRRVNENMQKTVQRKSPKNLM